MKELDEIGEMEDMLFKISEILAMNARNEYSANMSVQAIYAKLLWAYSEGIKYAAKISGSIESS